MATFSDEAGCSRHLPPESTGSETPLDCVQDPWTAANGAFYDYSDVPKGARLAVFNATVGPTFLPGFPPFIAIWGARRCDYIAFLLWLYNESCISSLLMSLDFRIPAVVL